MKKKESTTYDKIFKENIEVALPALIDKVLGIKVVSSEEIPDDLQRTKERKPDVLKIVIDDKGDRYILHLEIQLADEIDMIYRMLEYHAMLLRNYKIEIRQYVLYIGLKKPKMKTQLQMPKLNFEYHLIDIQTIDYKLFVDLEKPEEILLGILADFRKTKPVEVLEQIVKKIEGTTNKNLLFEKYTKQLHILTQLRNLDFLFIEVMEAISKYFDETRDPLFKKGINLGIEKGIDLGIEKGIDLGIDLGIEKKAFEFVRNLLETGKFTHEQITDLAGVKLEFVQKVRSSLS